MEDVNFGFYVTLFVTFLVFILVALKMAASRRLSKPNLPPGPWKLPVIGNLHQLVDPLPHHRLRDLARKHGDLMHLQLGELPYVIVSSAEIAHEIMITHDVNFSQRPLMLGASFYDFKGLAFAPYGDYWRQLKKIYTQELLSSSRVQSFRSIREEEVTTLIKQLQSASGTVPVNFSEKIQSLIVGITAKAAFGKKCKDEEAFIVSTKESAKHSAGFSVAELYPSHFWLQWLTGFWPIHKKLYSEIDGILQDIIKTRRADREQARAEESSRGNNLLDVLLDIQEKGNLAVQMDTKDLKANLLEVFFAGSDTTSTTLEWAMFELSRNPKAMEKAQAEVRRVFGGEGKVDETRLHELNYLKCIIKETLRLWPPTPLLVPRECRESCVINGYDIPAKTKVSINAWAIGRDPRYWRDPEKFHPERFMGSDVDFKGTSFELIPFGAGRRMCPGVSFAMANAEHTLAHLLFHFDWKLPDGVGAHNNSDAIERFGMTLCPKDDVYLISVPRSSASINIKQLCV